MGGGVTSESFTKTRTAEKNWIIMANVITGPITSNSGRHHNTISLTSLRLFIYSFYG